MSNAPKRRFKMPKPEATTTPREMPVIEQDYGRVIAQAGQAQYQLAIFTKDLARLNETLESLNYEAAARKKLEEKNVKTVTPEVVNAPAE